MPHANFAESDRKDNKVGWVMVLFRRLGEVYAKNGTKEKKYIVIKIFFIYGLKVFIMTIRIIFC